MKAIIQRVTKEQVSAIGRGLCVLLGISVEDTQKDVDYLVRKILNLRVFDDENGRPWSKSVMDREFEVLCISQFTLQCILKGNKPDFHAAMPAELAQPFYNKPAGEHEFGAYMQVNIQNDGPVTIELTSPTGPSDPKQMAKHEKQQQRKEKTRSKGPSESGREKAPPRSRPDPNASSGADGDMAKHEKQQQRKEKTRSKGPSESGREKAPPRSRPDPNASSGADGDPPCWGHPVCTAPPAQEGLPRLTRPCHPTADRPGHPRLPAKHPATDFPHPPTHNAGSSSSSSSSLATPSHELNST
ncbi:hypothetical protein CRUP_023975 [Coryphaenoides rupestris]|nr:hypothetical protein CRUP_023975 [Coryphaenoides rupestris]